MWIAALVLLALLLLLQLRIRLSFFYREGGLLLRLHLGLFRLQLYPEKEEAGRKRRGLKRIFGRTRGKGAGAEKRRRREKTKTEQKKTEDRSLGEKIDLLMDLLPLAGEMAGRLRRKILIRKLILQLNWGAQDPADAAIGYGRAHAVMGAVLPVLEANFRVKERDTQIHLDYELEKPNVYLQAQLSISLMQLLSLGTFAARKALGIYMKQRQAGKQRTRKAVQSNGTSHE